MLTQPVITKHPRDARLSAIPIDFNPDTLRWILDEGARGNILLQSQLFEMMEDTWARLRVNIAKCKHAVAKLPYNVHPHAEKGEQPTESALEKAKFVEHILHNQRAATWEGQHNFTGTIFSLMDAVARGVAVMEIDWAVVDGHYVPVGTRPVPASCLGFDMINANTPGGLRLLPDRDPFNPRQFSEFPHKFLVGVYLGKSGHIAKSPQLRALAPFWLARMLAQEWQMQRAELFGIPLRWATYDPGTSEADLNRLNDLLRNMGTATYAAFPRGIDLNIQSGSVPGVAGVNEPTERLVAQADRMCDLIFLGQVLSTEEGKSGSYSLGKVHREVELDQYENYALYIIDVINNQLIRSIIELNFGSADELPYLQIELDRPLRDSELVQRDKVLFHDMGLPVAKQWLYDRHKVPIPGPDEELFEPLPKYLSDRRRVAEERHGGSNDPRQRDPNNPSSPSSGTEPNDSGLPTPPDSGTGSSGGSSDLPPMPSYMPGHSESSGLLSSTGGSSDPEPEPDPSPNPEPVPDPDPDEEPDPEVDPPDSGGGGLTNPGGDTGGGGGSLGSASGKAIPASDFIWARDLWPHPRDLIEAKSESTADLNKRKAAARKKLKDLIKRAKKEGKKLIWDATLDDRTTPYCMKMHGRAYGEAWTSPPPAHYNCRSRIVLK